MPDAYAFLSLNSLGAEVKDLHDGLRTLGYSIPKHEVDEQLFGVGTQHALLSFQARRKLRRTGVLDDRTKVALGKAVAGSAEQYRVEGRILFAYGLPAGNLRLRLYSSAFADAPVRLAESTTDSDGFYLLTYSPAGKSANIEVRAVGSNDEEVPLSAVKFDAERREVLNLVAPAILRPPAPEYDRLAADLTTHLGSLGKLAEARENGGRHDITLLHQATAWDARLIALAALAMKNGADTGLSQDVLYALFRAGLPTDAHRLARVSSIAIEKAVRKANQAGIVSLDDTQIAAAMTSFEAFARKARRDAKASAALSNLHELLADSGLTDAEEDTVIDLYFAHRGAPGELWKRVREKGISETKIANLRLMGKLGHLTFNNAVLAASLRKEIVSADNLAQLVDKDLHRADTWKNRLHQLAQNGHVDLNDLVPPAYGGSTPTDRLDAYAADLARKVRVSFPTHVVRRMIETDELRLGPEHSALKANVSTFLQNASGLGFELGRVPVNAFIEDHRTRLFPSATSDVEATIQSVKTLARLYQATPSDDALKAVYDAGFTSAREIAAWSSGGFLDRFAHRFPSVEEAALTYRKAQQISTVTYNVVTMAKLMDIVPRVYATFPPPQSPDERPREDAREHLISHYPTLESFFGSVDFCECEHCRSVLSPAAYFVDLLQFLERDETGDAPYEALIERRPDLPHLALTCENTNISMPYIDVANEILEYYVANGGLSESAARDTGASTAAELLAEPQNILPAAYHTLNEARYPLGLPFDLWLETVRRFLDHFETPLWQVLEVFRPTEDLFADAAPYDRAAILAEYLNISPAEYRIFTAPDVPGWYRLYGYTSREAATEVATDAESGQRLDLNSAKTLARRLGVSYVELVEIVRSDFMNSGPDRLELFSAEPAGCDFSETVLRDAHGDAVGDFVFLEINLFVRLWRKLGWTIEETDRALQVFLPRTSLPLTEVNIGDALQTALVYLAHLKALSEKIKLGQNSRLKLLSLWSDPPPAGEDPVAVLTSALNLTIPEFVALKELSGLDPLRPLTAGPVGTLNDDHPYRHTLGFVEVAETVHASAFTIEELDYLLRHRFDPVGKYRSEADLHLALVRSLAVDLGRLRAEHAIPSNMTQASGFTDDVLRQKLALVLAPEVVATFMGMWTGTLTPAEVFFEKYFQRHSIDSDTTVGFLEPSDFDAIFGGGHTDAEKRFRLATALLRFLQDTLGRQLIAQSLATSLGADRPLLDALLTRASLLSQPGHPARPLVRAFAAVGERGTTATFYVSEDGSGDPLATILVTDVDPDVIDPAAGRPAKPDGTRSARFEGYFEVPAAGAYRFFLVFQGDDTAGELQLADRPDFVLRGTADAGPTDQLVVDLKAGVPYRFTFYARQLDRGSVRLLIEGENLPKDSMARLSLYPDASIGPARGAFALLAKSIRLIQGLGLSEREVRYLLTHRADFNALDFGSLPTAADEVSPAAATALFKQFLRLADYARLKQTLAARSDDLVGIFEANALDVKYRRIAEVTRRDEATVRATAEQLGLAGGDLVQEQGLWRLWKALQVVGKLGVSVEDIASVAGIVGRGDAPEDRARRFAIADELKRAIKSRFEPAAWQRLGRPIFDLLRQRKRDALVACVLHNHPEDFESANQLFEYFLLDPGMEPVVETSRLRLAISCVQLFIQRCLLNLEPRVQPSAINAKHWQWMKRYRVWEANRKIFLFPENWLEPEFRDDKTHLFQELEGALLQGDVSNELAEEAFFNYLKGMERIAWLDIVAMYTEERADPASSILHVVGRAFNFPHKYFYRRYAHRMWTPWEPVTAEIEGDHLVALVWRERLHLFWLTFVDKATKTEVTESTFSDLADTSASVGAPKEVAVHLNWSEYFQGQWTPRESSGFDQTIHVAPGGDLNPREVFVHVSTESDGETEAAAIHFMASILFERPESLEGLLVSQKFRFLSKNYPPGFGTGDTPPTPPYAFRRRGAIDFVGSNALTISASAIDILQEGHEFRLLFGGGQSERATLGHRFFYQDDQHTFFVEPKPAVATLPGFEDLGVPGLRPEPGLELDDRWARIPIEPEFPGVEPRFVVDPDDPRWADPLSIFEMHVATDWATDPATVIQFDHGVVGHEGGHDFAIVPEDAADEEPGTRVEVRPGSELPAGSVLITRGRGGSVLRPGVHVVGGGGLTSVLMRDVIQRQGAGTVES